MRLRAPLLVVVLAAGIGVPAESFGQSGADPFQSVPAPQVRPRPAEASPPSRQRPAEPAPQGGARGRSAPAQAPSTPEPPPSPEQRVRHAFATGSMSGLAGCWRSDGPWQTGTLAGRTGYRELCVSAAGVVSFSYETRSDAAFTGFHIVCQDYPGIQASLRDGILVVEAPPPTNRPCHSSNGWRGNAGRIRITCHPATGAANQLSCNEILARPSDTRDPPEASVVLFRR